MFHMQNATVFYVNISITDLNIARHWFFWGGMSHRRRGTDTRRAGRIHVWNDCWCAVTEPEVS